MKDCTSRNIYGSFYLNETEFALNIESVQEVVNYPDKIVLMPLSPSFLVGIFNLRGMIIPMIDLRMLLNMKLTTDTSLMKVAIVEYEGARIGLLFDRTSEILRVPADNIFACNYADDKSHRVVSAVIKMNEGERLLQVLNPFNLMTIENLPQILEKQNHREAQAIHKGRHRKKCITFEVAAMKLAFAIEGIHEIVKTQTYQSSSVQSDMLLGNINIRGRLIPVAAFEKILNISCAGDEKTCEDERIIILKINNELFGLKVDRVLSITSYLEEDVMLVPLLNKDRKEMFKGCISIHDEGEVFILSHESIFKNEEVLMLTSGHNKMYQLEEAQTRNHNKITRSSYISFKLQYNLGVSINDIKEIINYSDEVVKAPGMPAAINGMLNLRGKLITIINTKKLYAMDDQTLDDETKILVFEKGGEAFGLIVDSVESIVSVDREKNLKVPELVLGQIRNQFKNDIKEVIAISGKENKEQALIILNIDPIAERIKELAS